MTGARELLSGREPCWPGADNGDPTALCPGGGMCQDGHCRDAAQVHGAQTSGCACTIGANDRKGSAVSAILLSLIALGLIVSRYRRTL